MAIGDIIIKTGPSFGGTVILHDLGGVQVSGSNQSVLISKMFSIFSIGLSDVLANALTGGTGGDHLWVEDYTRTLLPIDITTSAALKALGFGTTPISLGVDLVLGGTEGRILFQDTNGFVNQDTNLKWLEEDVTIGPALYMGGSTGQNSLMHHNYIADNYFALGNNGLNKYPLLFASNDSTGPDNVQLGPAVGIGFSDASDMHNGLIIYESGDARLSSMSNLMLSSTDTTLSGDLNVTITSKSAVEIIADHSIRSQVDETLITHLPGGVSISNNGNIVPGSMLLRVDGMSKSNANIGRSVSETNVNGSYTINIDDLSDNYILNLSGTTTINITGNLNDGDTTVFTIIILGWQGFSINAGFLAEEYGSETWDGSTAVLVTVHIWNGGVDVRGTYHVKNLY